MLDVLADQRAALRARLGIDVKDGAQAVAASGARQRPSTRSSSPMTFEWTASVSRAGQRCQPALGCLDVRQRILARLAKTEHRASSSVTCRLETADCSDAVGGPPERKTPSPPREELPIDSGCKFRTDVRRSHRRTSVRAHPDVARILHSRSLRAAQLASRSLIRGAQGMPEHARYTCADRLHSRIREEQGIKPMGILIEAPSRRQDAVGMPANARAAVPPASLPARCTSAKSSASPACAANSSTCGSAATAFPRRCATRSAIASIRPIRSRGSSSSSNCCPKAGAQAPSFRSPTRRCNRCSGSRSPSRRRCRRRYRHGGQAARRASRSASCRIICPSCSSVRACANSSSRR